MSLAADDPGKATTSQPAGPLPLPRRRQSLRALPPACARTPLRRSLLSTAVLFAAYLAWLALLPDPITVTTVVAASERVAFEVTDRRLAALPIAAMRPSTSPADRAECLDGLLVPHLGAAVGVERDLEKNLAVLLISGQATFEPRRGGPPRNFDRPTEFLPDGRVCEGEPPRRFPVWGRLRLGEDLRPTAASGRVQPGLLLDGQLRIQARAIEHWLLVPGGRPTLYTAAEMGLPFGARLQAAAAEGGAAVWWGTAYVDDDKVGLQVAAATEAERIALFRPGRTTPDVVTVTALTQVFSDPNVIRVQVVVAALLAAAGLCAGLAALIPPR